MTSVTLKKSRGAPIARLISRVFNPWAVLLIVLGLAAYQAALSPLESMKWVALAYAPTVVFPLLYGRTVILIASRHHGVPTSRSLLRDWPRHLLASAVLFGVPSILILYFLRGPGVLLTIMSGITAVMLAVTLANIFYRVSFHVSLVTGMLTCLFYLFGPLALIGFVLVPALAISRYRLGEHTLSQMLTGFLMGLVISGVVFHFLNLTPS